jgi:hypothetical protein
MGTARMYLCERDVGTDLYWIGLAHGARNRAQLTILVASPAIGFATLGQRAGVGRPRRDIIEDESTLQHWPRFEAVFEIPHPKLAQSVSSPAIHLIASYQPAGM